MTYRLKQAIAPSDVSLAVVVQQQIASEVSGVAFSINPGNNCYDEAVIDSNFGLGETVVSGQVTPDNFVVNKLTKRILQKKLGTKDYVLVGKRPWGLALSRDEKTLLVANGLSDDLSIIDIPSRRVLKSVPVGRVPYGILIDD